MKLPLETLNPELPSAVSDQEAAEAASECGLTFFNPKKVKQLQKLGLYSAQTGVIHLGVGRLLAVDQQLQEMMNELATLVRKDGDDEIRVQAASTFNQLASTLLKSIQTQVDLHTEGHLAEKTKKRVFDPRAVAVPTVQVNVQAQGESEIKVVDASR
jgi:hypothetical protein